MAVVWVFDNCKSFIHFIVFKMWNIWCDHVIEFSDNFMVCNSLSISCHHSIGQVIFYCVGGFVWLNPFTVFSLSLCTLWPVGVQLIVPCRVISRCPRRQVNWPLTLICCQQWLWPGQVERFSWLLISSESFWGPPLSDLVNQSPYLSIIAG